VGSIWLITDTHYTNEKLKDEIIKRQMWMDEKYPIDVNTEPEE
jgi:hypothetical protein